MALVINIEIIDEEDYDGNPEQIKMATAVLDDVELPINYSFESTKTDTEIETEVEADLINKGYSWE